MTAPPYKSLRNEKNSTTAGSDGIDGADTLALVKALGFESAIYIRKGVV